MTSARPHPPAPYSANHNRVRKVRGSANQQLCEGCCGRAAKDWALVHGKVAYDPASYVPLCRSCHWHYDIETQGRGPLVRSLNPEWQASRTRMKRDQFGRFVKWA